MLISNYLHFLPFKLVAPAVRIEQTSALKLQEVQFNFYQTTRSNVPGDIIFICEIVLLNVCKQFAGGRQQVLKDNLAVQYCISSNERLIAWSNGLTYIYILLRFIFFHLFVSSYYTCTRNLKRNN